MIGNPPSWLQEWPGQIGAEFKDGPRENPGRIAVARENGTVYHTYTVPAPDPFVSPYFSFLLERTPRGPHPQDRTLEVSCRNAQIGRFCAPVCTTSPTNPAIQPEPSARGWIADSDRA